MILPEMPLFTNKFYFLQSAFTPLHSIDVVTNSMRTLRQCPSTLGEGSIMEKKNQDQTLSLSQSVSEKSINCFKNDSNSTFGFQLNGNKQFQKNFISQRVLQIQDQLKQLDKNSHPSLSKQKLSSRSSSSIVSPRLRTKTPIKYQFDSDTEQQAKQSKKCETKNIIKNFIRSVLSFLRKNQSYKQKLLRQSNPCLALNPQIFQQFLQKIQGKINTITELRELWTNDPYSQILRIISSHFLRKYYPKHIFNSRIYNHQVHLKYRGKLMKSLERPEEFTSLKEF